VAFFIRILKNLKGEMVEMIILKNLNLIGPEGVLLENKSVVIEETKIKEIADGNVNVPTNVEAIDMKGYTILPGLIDTHLHLGWNGEPDIEVAMLKELLPMASLKAYVNARDDLMAGFTTVRALGDRGYLDVALKKAIEKGIVDGPRMKVAGQPISMTGGHGDMWLAPEVSASGFGVIADGLDEMRKAARYQIKMGADFIKLMATGGVMSEGDEPGSAQLSEEEMKVAIKEAHKAGRKSAAHAQGTEGIKNAVRAGIDSIEHGIFLDEEAIQMMKENGVFLVPTLSAVFNIKKHGKEAGIPEFAVRKVEQIMERHVESFKMAYKGGVKIALGTDAATPFNKHGENAQELELMVNAGMTPKDAITAATKGGAELLGMEDMVGTLEAGKEADIIAVEGNPLEDVTLLKDVKFVMKAGKIYKFN
jgi:imidazolonepropionase-like amidohydrolase